MVVQPQSSKLFDEFNIWALNKLMRRTLYYSTVWACELQTSHVNRVSTGVPKFQFDTQQTNLVSPQDPSLRKHIMYYQKLR